MKISKLFHWLYAVLMLLPVLFIGTRCLYTIFNKNAKDSYSGDTTYEINYKYQSNEVNSVNDLVVGNIYEFSFLEYSMSDFDEYSEIYFRPLESFDYFYSGEISDLYTYDDLWTYQVPPLVYTSFNNDTEYLTFYIGDNSGDRQYIELFANIYDKFNAILVRYDFQSTSNNIITSVISYTSYNEIESVDIDNTGTLDNAFIYSVNQINEVPLFAWAKDSFLVTPFTYITGLFGVPSTSPINTMLSYWLDISIIWLVFDLVMYVPLLVHRWLDKGVLE